MSKRIKEAVESFIEQNYQVLQKENFDNIRFDDRLNPRSWFFDKDLAEKYKKLYPVSMSLLLHPVYREYMDEFRAREYIKNYALTHGIPYHS